jgi:uncharacterized repeat protein (TIGR02543 family)
MKKIVTRTFAMLLAGTLTFSSTSFTTYASFSNGNFANVISTSSANELETSALRTSNAETTSTAEMDDSTSNTETNTTLTDSVDTSNAADSASPDNDSDLTSVDAGTSNDSSVENTIESIDGVSSTSALDNETTSDTQLDITTSTTEDIYGENESMNQKNQTSLQSEVNADTLNEASDYTWKGITFGQSTDLNFQSTILPEKIGTQYANETQINVIDSTTADAAPKTKEAVVIESRGGKIANAHDGLTFYYTTLPTSKNFVLEAKVFINQFGPEDGKTPSKQEAVGVMARDVIGAARQNPMVDGYEELPAASNTAVTMILANAKAGNTPLNIVSYQRNGVYYPYGNAHISYSSTKFAQLNKDGAKTVTEDITPVDGSYYDSNDFFTLRLERTDFGFITTYIDAEGNAVSGSIDDSAKLAVIDKDNMYVGFFSSRNAKVTYTDIYLETSEANTQTSTFVPDAYPLSFTNLSNTETSTNDYTVAFRTNFDGTAEIIQDGSVIEAAETVTAGKIYELSTTLSNASTSFTINYTSSGGSKSESFTVTKNEAYQKDLYVSVDGTSDAAGDIDSPLDLTTAINYLSEGYTIYLRGGTYGSLDLASTQSGSSKGAKTLAAYNGEAVIFSRNSYVKASYWNIKGISVTGSNSAGLRASGNSNTFESCTFYANEDTGFQLGMGSDTDPLTWPEDNTIKNCTSYNNVDVSGINADGFAAKLGVGKGNVFDSCISFQNADDGWDLFNKLGDAKNEPVTIQNCIAYGNGNNGFKLGGEGYAVDHVVTGSLAFTNGLDGFTDNFNTGVLTITNCTSVDNTRYNYIFRLNPYKTVEEQGVFSNNISFRSSYDTSTKADYISGNIVNSYFFDGENNTITSNDFVNTTAPAGFERNADGSINYGDYMKPDTSSFLASSGVGAATYLGAVKPDASILVTTINLNTNKIVIAKAGSVTLTASISPKDATNPSITWTSSDTSIATVDQSGKVTGKAYGKAVIASSSNDNPSLQAACKVSVGYKIIYKLNKGTNNAKNPAAYYNQKVKLYAPTRKGYLFAGWYTDGKFTTRITSIKKGSKKNYTLYAKWEKVKKPASPTIESVTNSKSKNYF